MATFGKTLILRKINSPSNISLFVRGISRQCVANHFLRSRSLLFKKNTNFLDRCCKVNHEFVVCSFARAFSSDLPDHHKIRLPALSPTMEMGSIVKWEKNEGDNLSEGDLLCEIETDKATMGFETPEDGYLAKILIAEGTRDVPLGKLLCIIVYDEENLPAFKNYVPSPEEDLVSPTGLDAPEPAKPEPTPPPKPTLDPGSYKPVSPHKPSMFQPPPPAASKSMDITSAVKETLTKRILATPRAKSLAKEKGIELSSITGTGPNGQIRVEDVENFTPQAAPVAAEPVKVAEVSVTHAVADYEDITLTGMRQTIAKRLLFSKQSIPHFYVEADINMENVISLRKDLNSRAKDSDIKLSFNDFVIKAAAIACMRVPAANSAWMDTFIRKYTSVDISMAVATEAGLITPIIFGANNRGLNSIHGDAIRLAAKARDGKLQPNEFLGGTFTISNMGMLGVKSFTAIINPPQSCILAVGALEKQVVPDDSRDSGFGVVSKLNVTLGCDHRVVDGAVGAQWMKEFKTLMEHPATMLL